MIPTLLYQVLPLDTVEAVIWGQSFTMGNCKHPPLSGWLANAFSSLFGHADFAMYFLSQLLVATSYLYIYRLAREFLDETMSVASSILLGLTIFYSFDSAKYNVNIVHLALWPMIAFYLIRAVRSNRMLSWVQLGITAGLCMICKLFGGVLLVMLFAYMLFDPTARSRFRSPGPYVTACLTIGLFAPYAVWLYQVDFLPFVYVSERVYEESNPFWFPLEVLFFMSAPILLPLAALILSGGKEGIVALFRVRPRIENRPAFLYSGYLFWTPILFMTILSFFVPKVDPMWVYPIYYPMGIFLMSLVRPDQFSPRRFRWFACIILAGILSFQMGDVLYFLIKPREKGHFPAHVFATDADTYYREKTGQSRIPIVCGTLWHSCVVQHYLPYRPTVCILEDPLSVRRYRDQIRREGGLFVLAKEGELELFQKEFGLPLTDRMTKIYQLKSFFGKTMECGAYLYIIRPEVGK